MEDDVLFDMAVPGLLTSALPSHAIGRLVDRLQRSRPASVVRAIRGRKSHTVTAFDDEIAAAMQFPLWYGQNSNAFRDCISDLMWLPGDAYLVIVADADHLLADARADVYADYLGFFVEARDAWRSLPEWKVDAVSRPFQVLLDCHPDDIVAFEARLTAADVTFTRFHTDR